MPDRPIRQYLRITLPDGAYHEVPLPTDVPTFTEEQYETARVRLVEHGPTSTAEEIAWPAKAN